MKKAARNHPEAAPFVTSLATNQPLHLSVRCNGESVATGSPQAIPDADEPRLFAPLQPGFFLSGPKGRAARYPLRGRPRVRTRLLAIRAVTHSPDAGHG